MKTYKEFIKEVSYSVYGQATLGSRPGTATDQQIKLGVDRAIKNVGTGKGSGQIGQKGGFGLSGGGYVSMSGSISKPTTTTTKPTTTKPTTTKPTTTKTKDPKENKVKPPTTTKITPTTSTLIKGTFTKGTQTSTPNNTPIKPSGGSTPIRPIRPIVNNSNRFGGGSTNILQKGSM